MGRHRGSTSTIGGKAFETGHSPASPGHRTFHGGGHVGLMWAVADGCLEVDGRILGVMPTVLADREIAHKALGELILVETMHARKSEMAGRSNAFIVLPGGNGTLDEFFEQWTWGRIGLHAEPLGLLNVNGCFNPLLQMLDQMVHCGFLSETYRMSFFQGSEVDHLLKSFGRYRHPPVKGHGQGQ